jgi:hypothetical protein
VADARRRSPPTRSAPKRGSSGRAMRCRFPLRHRGQAFEISVACMAGFHISPRMVLATARAETSVAEPVQEQPGHAWRRHVPLDNRGSGGQRCISSFPTLPSWEKHAWIETENRPFMSGHTSSGSARKTQD